jgi:hypothetical protein
MLKVAQGTFFTNVLYIEKGNGIGMCKTCFKQRVEVLNSMNDISGVKY